MELEDDLIMTRKQKREIYNGASTSYIPSVIKNTGAIL